MAEREAQLRADVAKLVQDENETRQLMEMRERVQRKMQARRKAQIVYTEPVVHVGKRVIPLADLTEDDLEAMTPDEYQAYFAVLSEGVDRFKQQQQATQRPI